MMSGQGVRPSHRLSLPPGPGLPFRPGWHGGHFRTLPRPLRSTSRLSCWLWSRRGQSHRLPDLSFKAGRDVLVVLQELAGVLASLADALAFIAEPRARLFENVLIHGNIEQIAFARNTFAINYVEFGFAEGGCNLVLHHLHLGTRTSDHVSVFDRGDAPDVDTNR